MEQNKKPKDYAWVLYLIVLAIAAAVSLPSCGNTPDIDNGRKKTKVHKVIYSYTSGYTVDYETTYIKWIDTSYKPGEMFILYDKCGLGENYTIAHYCSDNTHKTCDGQCECDGYACEK